MGVRSGIPLPNWKNQITYQAKEKDLEKLISKVLKLNDDMFEEEQLNASISEDIIYITNLYDEISGAINLGKNTEVLSVSVENKLVSIKYDNTVYELRGFSSVFFR